MLRGLGQHAPAPSGHGGVNEPLGQTRAAERLSGCGAVIFGGVPFDSSCFEVKELPYFTKPRDRACGKQKKTSLKAGGLTLNISAHGVKDKSECTLSNNERSCSTLPTSSCNS